MRRKSIRPKINLPKRTPWKKEKKAIPRWVKAIPESTAHGSGTLQKRLWRLCSDFVRIRDFYQFGGVCVATGVKISHWSVSDAGHFKSYSVCRGLYKFSIENIHMQSKASNGWGGQQIGHSFGEELKRRYGPEALTRIEQHNAESSLKFTKEEFVAQMKELVTLMATYPEKPAYLDFVLELMGNEETVI